MVLTKPINIHSAKFEIKIKITTVIWHELVCSNRGALDPTKLVCMQLKQNNVIYKQMCLPDLDFWICAWEKLYWMPHFVEVWLVLSVKKHYDVPSNNFYKNTIFVCLYFLQCNWIYYVIVLVQANSISCPLGLQSQRRGTFPLSSEVFIISLKWLGLKFLQKE